MQPEIASSKLTKKYRVIIPEKVRKVLGLAPGDIIVFDILPNNRVILRKASPFDLELIRYLESSISTK